MEIRKPVVAGQFYGADSQECMAEIYECISRQPSGDLPRSIVAAIVPHAGWTFSGELAGLAFSAVKKANESVNTFIIFGTAHRYIGSLAVVYDKGKWLTPIGQINIDEELAADIISPGCIEADPSAHTGEHSIEVQVPFIQHLFSNAEIVPVTVPPNENAINVGNHVASVISKIDSKNIVCVASTDLTHYGPRYGFAPKGAGQAGIDWAKDVNDAEFIDLALKMDAEGLLKAGIENCSACGPGAAAAAVQVAKQLGRTEGILLDHTTSSDIMLEKFHQPSQESVGYAAIIF